MRLSVIIPAYNEQATVLDIIAQVQACGVPDLELVVVNDCSTDSTQEVLDTIRSRDRLRIIHHEINQGKGAAIRTAQAHITGEVVVIQDADLEYNPREFPRMLKVIEDDIADAVYGSRYSGSELLVDTFWHYLGNRLLTTYSNVLCNLHLTDMETCYKMMRTSLFKQINIECNRFGFEPEVTAKLSRLRARIFEMPIGYQARSFDDGKKIDWKDGVAALWYITKYNLLSRRI